MPTASTLPATRVHRVEVRPNASAGDPRAAAVQRDAAAIGINASRIDTARVYLIEADLTPDQLATVQQALLANPVTETAIEGAAPSPEAGTTVEVHPLPGVMDPAAQTVADAVHDLTGVRPTVSTGWRYDLHGVNAADARTLAERLLANAVVTGVHTKPFHPESLPRGGPAEFRQTHVPIRGLDDAALERMSREAHLFLSLDEMRAIRDECETLGREPSDIELETIAQTWSEHCVHKTLKSTINYRNTATHEQRSPWIPIHGLDLPPNTPRPGHTTNPDGSVTIHNLLKSTVAAATHELIEEGHADWCLSVFVDNAGIVAFDDDHAVCVKVETHNHPSALEPYGGAATGIGGCIRDIIGTGLAAKPIASTDVFCVAPPDTAAADIPAGCLHPKRTLTEVVAGVRDYGNRMGIPTVNGAVWFDPRHIGNPLVFCGCIGVMPRHSADGPRDAMIAGAAKPGDHIIALGGRTGRDGIHGATFSSAELTDTHADEFAHAVQIGNPIEEKRVLDAILRARDTEHGPLFTAITDCGAGGFSSAVGEMGEKVGARVQLDRAPLKYDGLTYTEIWISEAQERMVLAVPEANLAQLQRICDEEHVELADLGTFGHTGEHGPELILNYNDHEVGRLPMAFLHDGIPMPTREATWTPTKPAATTARTPAPSKVTDQLTTLLAEPNIASKHWIIRQYDHEVQGNTAIKPLGGPLGRGPMDASVVQPVPGSNKGLAIACGLATGLEADPYAMTIAAIDECVRNLVCVGARPDRIAILDNFCWPSCKKADNLASLVRAAEGCYDAAKAYRTPFVSGKDSLNNQFTTATGETIEIPPTLLITGIAIVDNIARCITSDAKTAGNHLVLVGPFNPKLGGSTYERLFGARGNTSPVVDLTTGPRTAAAIADVVAAGLARSAHDVSDGGVLVTIAEMLIGAASHTGSLGFTLDQSDLVSPVGFAECPSCTVLEVAPSDLDAVRTKLSDIPLAVLGALNDTGVLDLAGDTVEVADLTEAWLGTLDW